MAIHITRVYITASPLPHFNVMHGTQLMLTIRADKFVLSLPCRSLCAVVSADGPLLCSNNGPTLIQELTPAYLRTRVGSSVTWSCEAVGETLPHYRWSKDYKVT